MEQTRNEASRWRLAVARQVGAHYAVHPGVQAVIVSGSVARGWADHWSDVEIGVFWNAFPGRDEFHTLVETAGGSQWELDPWAQGDDVQYEEYAVGGLKIDLRHMTVAGVEHVLTAVIDQAELDQSRQAIIAAILVGIPLAGEAHLRTWQTRAASYPEQLSEAVILQALDLSSWWPVPMHAARGDWHLVYGALREGSEAILAALLGLNGRYHPGSKWLAHTVADLPITPPELYGRLMHAFRAEPATAAEEMRLLIEATFDLVALHRPALDLTAQRAMFRLVRPSPDEAPAS